MSILRVWAPAAALTVLFAASAAAGEPDVPRQILVDLHDDTTDADELAIEAKLGGLDLKLNSIHAADERFFVADVDPSRMQALIAAIRDDPRVENVEPNYLYRMSMVPDDPMFERQWSLQMINTPEAWDYGTGKGVTIAVIDTGVAYENYGPFRQVEDLGGTGFAKGYDFVNDDEHPNDDHGHGTHVAGTIAQTTNNQKGVAGIAFDGTIMPIKVLDRMGRGNAADISDAIRWAADNGAQVINMSLGGGLRSFTMQASVKYARAKGVIVVCAAGNNGRGVVEFPAAYGGAFAVSSVGPSRTLARYSSWGKQIAIAAPGGDKTMGGDVGAILQNTIVPNDVTTTNRYLAFQGTSMAAPHVAGAAALVISAGVTNPDEVEALLRKTASKVANEANRGDANRYGAGILDVGEAAKEASGKTKGPAYLALALSLLFAFAQRAKRRGAKVALGAASIVGATLGASGLFFLQSFGVDHLFPGASLLSHPVAAWDLVAVGSGWFRTALWASFVPFFALATVMLGAKRWTGFLVGLGVGWAAHLLLAAVLMPADVQFIPGIASWLDRAWLVANAGVIGVISTLLTRR